jgi:hypothetical protein
LLNKRILRPAIPHKLPPRANVENIRNRFHKLTFHFACNFLNMLQKCTKHRDMIAFFEVKKRKDFGYKCMTILI